MNTNEHLIEYLSPDEFNQDSLRGAEPVYFIPNIKLVGYGRSQSFQVCCLKCKKLCFNLTKEKFLEDLFCEECKPSSFYLQPENFSNHNSIGNIVGWEIKSTSVSLKRSTYNYKKVYKRDGYECQYCRYSLIKSDEFRALHIDHILPFSCSGSNKMDNMVVSCSVCNQYASNKWFRSYGDKKDYILDILSINKRQIFT